MLALTLFGGIWVRYRNTEVDLKNQKAKALLAFLALSQKPTATRDRIVGLLWSETDEERARGSLRQTLRTLREALNSVGFYGFSTARADVALDGTAIDLDVRTVLRGAEEGRLHPALLAENNIAESLLSGFEDIDPAFHGWVMVQRESVRQQLTKQLERWLHSASYAHGKEAAEALIKLDQTHELAYRKLIRHYADAGDTAAAITAYNKLWKLLDSDYETEPDRKTQELIAAIKAGRYDSSTAVHAELEPWRPEPRAPGARRQAQEVSGLRLLVEPFQTQGVEKDHEALAVSFRYDLITRLNKFREWVLIDARTSPDPVVEREADQLLYRLAARFFQRNADLKVVFTLQAQTTGVVVWSAQHNMDAAGFFETQQHVLQQVAMALNVHLSVERLKRIASIPDISLELYDRWLRGQMLMQTYRPELRARARQMYESIIAVAPHFAPAHSSLAQLQNSSHIVLAGTYSTPETRQAALASAKNAVLFDPLDSRAQLCLGWAHAMNYAPSLAEAHFRQALELNEDDHWTATSVALGLAFCDLREEALKLMQRTEKRIPHLLPIHWAYRGQVRFVCADYDQSAAALAHVGGDIAYVSGWEAAALGLLGRTSVAVAAGQRFVGAIAENWYGQAPPTNESILRWFLHCFPFQDEEARECLRAGLEVAGIP